MYRLYITKNALDGYLDEFVFGVILLVVFNAILYGVLGFEAIFLFALLLRWLKKNWDWFSAIFFIVILPIICFAGLALLLIDSDAIPMIFGG